MASQLRCSHCHVRLSAFSATPGAVVRCPCCGSAMQTPQVPSCLASPVTGAQPPHLNQTQSGSTSLRQPSPSQQGIVATIIKACGSGLRSVRSSVRVRSTCRSIARTCGSILRLCLIMSGWLFVLLVKLMSVFLWIFMLVSMLSSAVAGRGRSHRGRWGTALCHHCLYTWYPRGHYSPRRCPSCGRTL
jgi:hypothetical protein